MRHTIPPILDSQEDVRDHVGMVQRWPVQLIRLGFPFNYSTDPIVTCVRCLARTHSHKRHDAINSRCLSPGTSPLDQPTVITFETNARFLTLSFSWPYCRLSNSERICSSWPDKFNSSGIMFAATFIQWFLARRSPHPTNHQFTHVTPDFFMDSPIITKRRTK